MCTYIYKIYRFLVACGDSLLRIGMAWREECCRRREDRIVWFGVGCTAEKGGILTRGWPEWSGVCGQRITDPLIQEEGRAVTHLREPAVTGKGGGAGTGCAGCGVRQAADWASAT